MKTQVKQIHSVNSQERGCCGGLLVSGSVLLPELMVVTQVSQVANICQAIDLGFISFSECMLYSNSIDFKEQVGGRYLVNWEHLLKCSRR